MFPKLVVGVIALTLVHGARAQAPASGKRVRRLLIHNAMVVDGNGTPASGPKDIVVENNTISEVIPLDAVASARGSRGGAQADAVIDATGKYVLPGLINAHAHLQEERGEAAAAGIRTEHLAIVRHHDDPRRRQRYEAGSRDPQAECRGGTGGATHFRLPDVRSRAQCDGGSRPGAVAEAAGCGRHQDSGHRSRRHGGDGGRGAQGGTAHRAPRRGRRD